MKKSTMEGNVVVVFANPEAVLAAGE